MRTEIPNSKCETRTKFEMRIGGADLKFVYRENFLGGSGISSRQTVGIFQSDCRVWRSAEWNSAIRQIGNLRYGVGIILLLLFCVVASSAREKWPQPTEEERRKAERERRHEEEVCRKIE